MGGELNKGPETLNARGNRGLNGVAPPSGGGKVKRTKTELYKRVYLIQCLQKKIK